MATFTRIPHRPRAATRSLARLTLLLTLVATVLGASALPAAAESAPRLRDPQAKGHELAREFLDTVASGDRARLARFLSRSFLLQRADGTHANKTEYLAAPATVTAATIGDDLEAVQTGAVLTVRWSVAIQSTIGGQPQATGFAPRLSVFHYEHGHWRIVAHANFNRPAT